MSYKVPAGMFPLTPGSAMRRAYGLWVETAGTVEFVDAEGDTVSITKGDDTYVFCEVSQITSNTTATVWGLKAATY